MSAVNALRNDVAAGIKSLYDQEIEASSVLVNVTRKDFPGDYSIVCFPFTKMARKKPEEIAQDLGTYFVEQGKAEAFNIVKGFLNLEFGNDFWMAALNEIRKAEKYGWQAKTDQKIMVEFASPNTNKPLHLGHIRNILLGWSISNIYKAIGFDVIRTQIVNDRGIAICKSMLAWEKFGEGASPESTGMKSDFFVGKYYVEFETRFKKEYADWQSTAEGKATFKRLAKENQSEEAFFRSYKNKYFNDFSLLGKEAKAMLLKWENNDEAVKALWTKMNNWVYEGFETTYEMLQVEFDKLYYESDTYLLGKDIIEKGLNEGLFFKKEDGSIWVDLTDAKLDEKILLRGDGTSVYMTQDLGTAHLRYEDFGMNNMVYTVADEQDYHFKVLFETLKRMKAPFADGLHHLSYGMVELPSGRMKSREGTVVDADDLIAEVIDEASNASEESGHAGSDPIVQAAINRKIGMAALKFFMIKVNPKKRMIFDPKESVDMHGQTGPYIQNAYVRFQSIKRKMDGFEQADFSSYEILDEEKELIVKLIEFEDTLIAAAKEFDPSSIANYTYELSRLYHRYYGEHNLSHEEDMPTKSFRYCLSEEVAKTLKNAMELLGIEMPERM